MAHKPNSAKKITANLKFSKKIPTQCSQFFKRVKMEKKLELELIIGLRSPMGAHLHFAAITGSILCIESYPLRASSAS